MTFRVLVALLWLALPARAVEVKLDAPAPTPFTPTPVAALPSVSLPTLPALVGSVVPEAASIQSATAGDTAHVPHLCAAYGRVAQALDAARAQPAGSQVQAESEVLDAAFDRSDLRRGGGEPVVIPPEVEPELPSRQDEATWTRETSAHAHSVFSDGTMTPEAVVDRAHAEGVRKLALSDHDTVAGVARAYLRAKALGMDFHPSAELTARGGVHVGAVDIDIFNPKLTALLARVRASRYKHAEAMAGYLNGAKIESDLESLGEAGEKPLERLRAFRAGGGSVALERIIAQSKYEDGGTVEMPHVARALLEAGLIDHVDDAFDTFFKKLPSFPDVPPDPTVEEVLEAVHAAGGKAFLNHPYTVRGRDDAEKDRKAYAILKKGFDGIEVYRPSNATSPQGKRRHDEQVAKYLGWAKELGLVVGNGADFHGDDTHLNHISVWMPRHYEADLLAALRPAQRRALAALERAEPPSFAPQGLGFVASTPTASALSSYVRALPIGILLIAIALAGALIVGFEFLR